MNSHDARNLKDILSKWDVLTARENYLYTQFKQLEAVTGNSSQVRIAKITIEAHGKETIVIEKTSITDYAASRALMPIIRMELDSITKQKSELYPDSSATKASRS